jgi:hypothetical protein
MRPVTTYVRQVRRVPVTTYRLVCSPAAHCGTGCGTGAVSTYSLGTSCDGCSPAAAPVYSAPAVTPGPAVETAPDTSVPQTYYEGSSTRTHVAPQPPIPDTRRAEPEFDNTTRRDTAPALRSASMPMHRVVVRRPAGTSVVVPARSVEPVTIDDGGWRSAGN